MATALLPEAAKRTCVSHHVEAQPSRFNGATLLPSERSGRRHLLRLVSTQGLLKLVATVLAVSRLQLAAGVRLRSRASSQLSYRQVLHNYQNVQYYADFEIGGQTIAGIFDTGSFELLVRSSRCSECVHPTPPYDHALSSSYEPNGTTVRHVFGSGPCVSMQGYDSVSVGGVMHAQRQTFWEIVQHQIPVLDTAKFAAIVGIGPNWAFGNKEKTLLMSYGIDEFSICLQKERGSEGYLTWGPEQTQMRKGRDYASVDVIGQHHWVAKMDSVSFDKSHSVQVPCNEGKGCAVIFDSGTSLIAAPGAALMKLSEQIPPIAEDCSNVHEMPNLRFEIAGGHVVDLPPQAYIMRIKGEKKEASIWDTLFFRPRERKSDTCLPAFMQLDMESDHGAVWILGMPFFRYYHVTFDRKNTQVHLAVAGKDCEPTPFTSSRSASLLAVDRAKEQQAMDVDVDAMIPPRLAEMMDYPFATGGELVL